MEISAVGNLTQMIKDIEVVFEKHGFKKPALGVAFTLPPDYQQCHWATNVSRADGILIFQNTAVSMTAHSN